MSPWVVLGAFLLCVVLGEPLFVTIGAVTLICFNFFSTFPADYGWLDRSSSLVLAMADIAEKGDLLIAIPLFTWAGTIMTHGTMSKRLIGFAKALLGWLPGGLGIACVVACAIFAAMSGSSSVTIIAIGGMIYPALKKESYGERFGLGLLTSCGAIGTLIPPSLPLIVYGVVAGNAAGDKAPRIDDLFIAGIGPSVLTILALCAYSLVFGGLKGVARERFRLAELLRATKEGFFALLMPVILLGGIYGGITTVTEASGIAVFYALLCELVIYRELSPRAFGEIIVETMVLVGSILIILVAALAFTNYLNDAQIPERLTRDMCYDQVEDKEEYETYVGTIVADTPESVKIEVKERHGNQIVTETVEIPRENVGQLSRRRIESKTQFLLLVNGILLVVGCIMDIFSGIIVIVPLVVPMALAYDTSLLHLGVIFAMNLELGFVTPPFGINLFISQSFFRKSMATVFTSTLPFLALLLGALAAVTFWEGLSLWLVEWIR